METVSLLAFFSSAALAVPVIPGAAGYGMDTPAGRGGVVMRVTNLSDSGSGSLRACVEGSGPRVCVFDVSGTILLKDVLNVRSPYLTIAGQTAPSPGILLRGAGLRIASSHVLVQHIRVRVGDSPTGPDPSNRDALQIETSRSTPLTHVVVDHCSFSWSVDEVVSIWEGASNVTLRNNVFSEPLHDSIHVENGVREPHGYGIILGPSDGGVGNISLVGNLMAHQAARNPLAYSSFVMVNNVVYDRADVDVEFANRGVPTSASVVGNVFKRGPSSVGTMPAVYVRGGSGSDVVLSGSRLYMKDNMVQGSLLATALNATFLQSPVDTLSVLVNSAPIWPGGLVAASPMNDAVLASVLGNAGARPADRDPVDARIVSEVRNGTGQVINCVAPDGTQRCSKNGGGWPSLAQRTRVLSLPANHQQVGSDGYTALEKWLHKLALDVEGKTDRPVPPYNAQLY